MCLAVGANHGLAEINVFLTVFGYIGYKVEEVRISENFVCITTMLGVLGIEGSKC